MAEENRGRQSLDGPSNRRELRRAMSTAARCSVPTPSTVCASPVLTRWELRVGLALTLPSPLSAFFPPRFLCPRGKPEVDGPMGFRWMFPPQIRLWHFSFPRPLSGLAWPHARAMLGCFCFLSLPRSSEEAARMQMAPSRLINEVMPSAEFGKPGS